MNCRIFIVKTKIMATLNFTTAYSTTLEGVLELTPSTIVYTEDLDLCLECNDLTQSCWACLQTTQQVFSDVSLTTPVVDGYYMVIYTEDESKAIWKIEGGYPQSEEFFN
jgi:predicted Rdx family selenoprotein